MRGVNFMKEESGQYSEENFWKWHRAMLDRLNEGFSKIRMDFFLSGEMYKGDKEEEIYKKNDLLFCLLFNQLQLVRDLLELIKRNSYYSAKVISCSLLEQVIIRNYISSNLCAFDDFSLFVTIEDLKTMKSCNDSGIKCKILNILKMDSHKASLNRLKKDKNKIFVSDSDYLNRENYKKDWKPTIKEMCETANRKDIYDIYSQLCEYKHFNPHLLILTSVSNIDCFDEKLFRYSLIHSELEKKETLHYLSFLELYLISSIKLLHGSEKYFKIQELDQYKKLVQNFDDELIKAIIYLRTNLIHLH